MKTYQFLCAVAVCSSMTIYHPSVSADIVTTAAAGSSVSGLIDQLKDAAEKVIHELDDKFSLNAFRIRQDMALLISELNNVALELERQTFKDLNATQKSFFSQAETAILVAAEATNTSIDKLGEIQIRVSDTIAGFPFVRKTARVLTIEPTYIVSTFYGSVDSSTLESNSNANGVTPFQSMLKDIVNPAHTTERNDIMKQAEFLTAIDSTEQVQKTTPSVTTESKTWVEKREDPTVEALKLDNADYSGQFEDVIISIKGSDLNYGPASLTFGAISCKVVEQIDSRLAFKCPGRSFISNRVIDGRSGDLLVTDYQPWYKQFINWVTGKPAPTRSFQTYITVVPQKLGDYSVTAVVQTALPIFESRSQPIAVGNEHCVDQRSHNVRINRQGDPTWSINYKTVAVTETSGNRGRSVKGPLETGPNGFILNVSLQNGGSCGPNRPFSGKKVWYDARAWFNGVVSWQESKTIEKLEPTVLSSGPLFWGKDLEITLPPGTQDFKVTIKQVNNMIQTVLGDDKKPWFRVKSDTTKSFLVISPENLEYALN